MFGVSFKPSFVLIDPVISDKDIVISRLINLASTDLGIESAVISKEVFVREEQMSTALGKGIAVPHARLADVGQASVYAMVTPRGVEWDSPDGDPVFLAFLLITPQNNPKAQIQILQNLASGFRSKDRLDDILNQLEEGNAFAQIKSTLVSCSQCQLQED